MEKGPVLPHLIWPFRVDLSLLFAGLRGHSGDTAATAAER